VLIADRPTKGRPMTEAVIRRSTAQVVPEKLDDFLSYLAERVRPLPATYPGLAGHRILCDRAGATVVYESTWTSQRDLEEFAGPSWREQPVTMPGEEVYLEGPLVVQHFHEVAVD
jgi:hypothetical protein